MIVDCAFYRDGRRTEGPEDFDRMPELHWFWSYPAVVPARVGLEILLYRLFKRRGWLWRSFRLTRARGNLAGDYANSGAVVAGPPRASRRSGIFRETMRRQPTARS